MNILAEIGSQSCRVGGGDDAPVVLGGAGAAKILETGAFGGIVENAGDCLCELRVIEAGNRRVLDPDYYLPEPVADRQGCTCVFAAAELPLKGRYRFSVRPLECFGVKGREISALWACPA